MSMFIVVREEDKQNTRFMITHGFREIHLGTYKHRHGHRHRHTITHTHTHTNTHTRRQETNCHARSQAKTLLFLIIIFNLPSTPLLPPSALVLRPPRPSCAAIHVSRHDSRKLKHRGKANLKLLLFFALPQQLQLLQPGKLHLGTTTRECSHNKRKTSNKHHLEPLLLPANFLTLSNEFSRQNLFDESEKCEIECPPITDFF